MPQESVKGLGVQLNGDGKPGALEYSAPSPHQEVGGNGQLKYNTSETGQMLH